jgi:purine-binding chemotaxis protein CheW
MPATGENERFLICSSGGRMLALPLSDVRETMRPLPIERLPGVPDFVLGLSLIRGLATPVIDAGQLLGRDVSGHRAAEHPARRLVTLNTGVRPAALQVDAVSSVQSLSAAQLGAIPSLLQESANPGLAGLSVLDERLLLVLQAARLVPSEVWQRMDRAIPS